MPNAAEEKIESYLVRLRAHLRGLSSEDIHDIIEELRSHIVDKAKVGGGLAAERVDAALEALGKPEDLASEYMADAILARAESSRSPLRILASLFRWATLSIAGCFVLIGSLLGYFLGCALILCALLKPFHPHSAGLWRYQDSTGGWVLSLRLGFGSVPAGSHDLLGWWIVPIGLLVGFVLIMLTTRLAIWCVRVCRKSRPSPGVESYQG
jgi:hypothetical protein